MRTITYREAIREALDEELARDERVFLIGEDIADPFGGTYKVTQGLSTKYGAQRVRNTPIAEAGYIGISVGAAMLGMRPVAELMYVDFAACCFDALANQAAKIRYMSGGQAGVPLVVRTQQGTGRSSAAQHAQSFEALFAHIPGLKVAMPATPADAKGLLKTAIRDDDPVVFLEHKLLYNTKGEVPDGEHLVPFGRAEIRRPGREVTVVATSRMVSFALDAAERLAAEGIEIEIVDPRTIVPLDRASIVASVRRTTRAVVVHEAVERCGFGAELAAIIQEEAFERLNAPVKRVAARNAPVAFAPALEQFQTPGVTSIVDAVHAVMA
jgi:pyruvate/2-oxoglutarate/acetoin dehydrogenase E1 component